MKYIKSFIDRQKERISTFQRDRDIDKICKKYKIKNYKINTDGSIDVDGDVRLDSFISLNFENALMRNIPIKFNVVSGSFNIRHSGLETLENSPNWVGGNFDCGHNFLSSLEGGPNHVGGNFDCDHNHLISLVGGPNHVGNRYDCGYNHIVSLEGLPKHIVYFECFSNPIQIIWNLIEEDPSKVELFNDYDIIQGTDQNPTIVLYRLEEFLKDSKLRGSKYPGLKDDPNSSGGRTLTNLKKYYTIEY